jgi:ubiquinone/menaquinone biosynthesis C-methylase UbiE
MLEQARNRTAEHGWRNVELVCTDAADYMPPPALDGALSTFALSLSPRADDVIVRTTRALRPGGRLVILDLKMPPPPLERFVPWLLPLVRPFAVDDQVLAMRPWERIWGAMFRHLDDVHIEEHYGGIAYLASGSAR